MAQMIPSPALQRLEWILEGLDGVDSWGHDADEVLAPEFSTRVPTDVFLKRVRARSVRHAPIAVVGLEVSAQTAKARLQTRDGEIYVLHCAVEPSTPHRITMTWMAALVPEHLTAGLPLEFSAESAPRAVGARLIVVSGVPGSGKSTLAEGVGRALGVPVFATDWLLGALTPFGGYHEDFDRQGMVADELLTTLALRQLELGQSAILDTPAEDLRSRQRWSSLAAASGARLVVVVCVCSDPVVHRARLEGRRRGIPGWHDAGDWQNVSKRLASFPPWSGEAMTIDSVHPLEHNVEQVVAYAATCPRRQGD
jgi:predicted kinase